MKKIALVDIDDTICSLLPELMWLCNELTGALISKSDWTNYDVFNQCGITNEEYFKQCVDRRILETAFPISKARRTLDVLEEQGFTIVYLTARGWHKDGKAVTKKWLEHWGFPKGKIHVIPLSESKVEYTKRVIGDPVAMVIDDNANHIRGFVDGKGAKQFFMIDQPWNKLSKDLDQYRISHISEVLKRLL